MIELARLTESTITARLAPCVIANGRSDILCLLSHLAVAPFRREGRRWLPGRQRARTLGPLWIGAAISARLAELCHDLEPHEDTAQVKWDFTASVHGHLPHMRVHSITWMSR